MATSRPIPSPEEDPASKPPFTDVQSSPPNAGNRPFVIGGRSVGNGGGDKTTRLLLIIGAVVVVFIVFIVAISTKGAKRKANADQTGKAGQPSLGRVVTPAAPGQLIPEDAISASNQGNGPKMGALDARDIEKTRTQSTDRNNAAGATAPSPLPANAAGSSATASRTAAGAKSLNDVPPFQKPNFQAGQEAQWAPEEYRADGSRSGGAPPAQVAGGQPSQASRSEDEQYTRPSLVFVARENNAVKGGLQLNAAPDNFGLQSGYHVAARLESMASTALHAPVTAVIEYNYERDGHLLIPAGARALGKITQADASGIMNITFDSIELPGNREVPISAIAATTSLQALKGDVTGKNAGRALAIRALAGLGSVAAMGVGQSSVNGAISEGDLIRQRTADNIGSGADAQIANMQLTQHIVVSVPAGTEIYLIFTKSQKVGAADSQTIAVGGATR